MRFVPISTSQSTRGRAQFKPGFVYVMRVPVYESIEAWRADDGRLGWKVGRTVNLPARLSEILMICRSVTLVALMPGTSDDEFNAHRALQSSCMKGGAYGVHREAREWYRDTPEFRAWLAAFPATWRGRLRCVTQEKTYGHSRATYGASVRRVWEKALGSLSDEQRFAASDIARVRHGLTMQGDATLARRGAA